MQSRTNMSTGKVVQGGWYSQCRHPKLTETVYDWEGFNVQKSIRSRGELEA